jgi:hypothetical protein
MNKYGTIVEWQPRKKNEVLGEQVQEPLCSLQISQELLCDRTHKRPATNHLVHGAPSSSVHVLPSRSCCWGHIGISFSAALACGFRGPVVYEITVFSALFFLQLTYFSCYITLHLQLVSGQYTTSGRHYLHDDHIRRLQEGFNDDSESSEEGCPFEWRVKERPALSWIHVVQGVWSFTFDSVNKLNPI